MNELFTVEEINLMCIFDTSTCGRLISELTTAMVDFNTGDPQSDAELNEIAANALAKLSGMSDADFAALELCPEYNDDNYYETEV
jgi:hypothetical protein